MISNRVEIMKESDAFTRGFHTSVGRIGADFLGRDLERPEPGV